MSSDYDPGSPAFQTWCRTMFECLADEGVWGVPRSGLIFAKRDDKLVLVQPEQLQADQRADFDSIQAHFGAAGILVELAA